MTDANSSVTGRNVNLWTTLMQRVKSKAILITEKSDTRDYTP